VGAFTRWCESLEEVLVHEDTPLAVDLSQPRVTVAEALRKVALSDRKRRRYDDL
jgi:hypothetical protein